MSIDDIGDPVFGDNIDDLLQDRIIEHTKKHTDASEKEPAAINESAKPVPLRKHFFISVGMLTTALLLIIYYFVKPTAKRKRR